MCIRDSLYSKPDSAFALAAIHEKRALSENNYKQVGLAHLTKGISWAVRGNYATCQYHFQRTLDIHDSIGYENGSMMASLNLGNLYRIKGDTIMALKMYDKSARLAKKLNNEIGVARNLVIQSRIFRESRQLDSALAKINEAIEIDTRVNNTGKLAENYEAQGTIYKQMYLYDLASASYLKALTTSRRLGLDASEASALSQLANLNTRIGEYENALDYANEAIAVQKDNNYLEALVNAYGSKLGALESLGRYDELKIAIDKALELIKPMDDPSKKVLVLNSLSTYYLNTGDFKAAISTENKIDSIITDSGIENISLKEYTTSVRAHMGLGDSSMALNVAEKGYDSAVSLNDRGQQISLSKLLAELYSNAGRYDKAYSYLNIYLDLKSQIDSKSNERAVLKATAYNEYEKKALQDSLAFDYQEKILIKENDAQKKISIAALVGLAVFALLAFFLFRSRRTIATQKEQISISLAEKDTLLREIHHRVKNNLQVVSSLLRLQTRSTVDEAAIDALTEGQNRVQSMSLIHQNLYQKENLTGIKMRDYLSNLSQSLFDTYKVDASQVKLELNIEDLNLDVDTVVPLGLIINELISNSLKYAFPNGASGTIKVDLEERDNSLNLVVSDSGIGLKEDVLGTARNSFGYTLIQTFTKKLKASLNVQNANGTRVELVIKNYSLHT